MKLCSKTHQSEKGFTLIELAIVLVIIGLLVGGVLGGQDLIKAAQIRNSQNSLETTNTNANAFRNKYGSLPGDLAVTQAQGAAFVATGAIFTAPATRGFPGYRDGNGLIDSPPIGGAILSGNNEGSRLIGGEILAFWTDLSASGVMAQAINTYTGANIGAEAAVPMAATPVGQAAYFHTLKIRNTATFLAADFNNRNHFVIGTFVTGADGVSTNDGATAANAAANQGIGALAADEAQQFDQKFDDGNPRTGTVFAVNWTEAAGINGGLVREAIPGATNPGTCQIAVAGAPSAAADAGAAYNTAATGFNCAIAVRTSF